MQSLTALSERVRPHWHRIVGLLVFSAALLVQGRSLTTLIPDDGVYTVVGLGLANGRMGFVHLPGAPLAVGIGPVYPAVLALVWRVWTQFPGNQALIALIDAACLGLAAVVMQRVASGVATSRAARFLAVPIGFLAFPVLAVASTRQAVPEFLLLAAIAVELAPRRARLAGIAAGLAAMTLSAGVGLIAGVVVSLWRRDRRAATTVLVAAMAVMLPWLAWVALFGPVDLWYVPRFWAGPPSIIWSAAGQAAAVLYGSPVIGLVISLVLTGVATAGWWRSRTEGGAVLAGITIAALLFPRSRETIWVAVPWAVVGLALALERVPARVRPGFALALLGGIAVPVTRQVSALVGVGPVERSARAAQNGEVLVTALNVEHPAAEVIMTSGAARFFLMTGRRAVAPSSDLEADISIRRACSVRVGLIAVPDSFAYVATVVREMRTGRPEVLEALFVLPQGPALYRLKCPS